MNNRTGMRRFTGAATAAASAFLAPHAAMAGPAPEHLLISEVVLAGGAGEYIEILNPTSATVDLSQYYLADSTPYWRVPGGGTAPSSGDFVAKFPAGSLIEPSQVVVISTTAIVDGFLSTYGVQPDFILPTALGSPRAGGTPPTMDQAFLGSLVGSHSLTETGEAVHLFFWDGASDLVRDVDVIRFGNPNVNNELVNKTGATEDGPDPDANVTAYATDAYTMPTMSSAAGAGFSHKRIALEGSDEVQGGGGNGITGHDETTENILITFDGGGGNPLTAPNPGFSAIAPVLCLADIAPPGGGNGAVNVDDLLAVINAWGACPVPPGDCPADITPQPAGDAVVNVDDLLAVINGWGDCPNR